MITNENSQINPSLRHNEVGYKDSSEVPGIAYDWREDSSHDQFLTCSIILRNWIWNPPEMMWEVPANM